VKTYAVTFSPEATRHLESIHAFISSHAGPDTARKFTAALVDYCETFSTSPLRGTRRDDLRPGL